MNRTEESYADWLDSRRPAVKAWWFEQITVVLPGGVRYTPDFLVQLVTDELQFHEVKGRWEDDARVKMKVAASIFPGRWFGVTVVPKRDGGGWSFEEFSPRGVEPVRESEVTLPLRLAEPGS